MLPDIHAQNRRVALHKRAVLVGQAVEIQRAVALDDKPRPAAAEACDAGLLELGLEVIKGAKFRVNCRGQRAGGCAACVGAQNRPEEGVVGVAATVVAHGGADVLRHLINAAAEILNTHVVPLGACNRVVDIRYIRLMMLIVVNLHRLRINGRLEGVFGIGQAGQLKGHRSSPFALCLVISF
jgi:hypothetical protein